MTTGTEAAFRAASVFIRPQAVEAEERQPPGCRTFVAFPKSTESNEMMHKAARAILICAGLATTGIALALTAGIAMYSFAYLPIPMAALAAGIFLIVNGTRRRN